MRRNDFLQSLVLLLASLALLSCTSEYHRDDRDGGVISTGNAGRIQVSAPSASSGGETGEFRILQATDSLPNTIAVCRTRLDIVCSETVPEGQYRAEAWLSGRIVGRTPWFRISRNTMSFELRPTPATTIHLEIQSSDSIDSVALGSRQNLATLVDGKWQVGQLSDSSDALWVKVVVAGIPTWKKYIQAFQGSEASITPVSTQAPQVSPITTLVLDASNCPWFETTIIGASSPPGSRDSLVYATDTTRGLAASWDASTVGRSLWRVQLPDSLRLKTLRSATLVYQTAQWGIRGAGILAEDYTVQAHRMLRSWKPGNAGYGTKNSSTVDGATPTQASWGISWNKYLVGIDGSDAEASIASQGTLKALSLEPIRLDITRVAQTWLSDPSTNFGLIFYSPAESSGKYPDYPIFWTSTARDPSNRPTLILELAP